jgi:hypothetical protein
MLGNRRGQRRFSMIYVTNGSHIHMRLGPLKLLLRHLVFLPLKMHWAYRLSDHMFNELLFGHMIQI